jgi:N-acetylglucosamine kinase-like BadF-type ATPase
MNTQYYIGMDGGGTKTHAVITDQHGALLADHVAGPSNFQIIGVEKAAETIFTLIEMCCDSVDCSIGDIASVTCGLTGAGRVGDQKRMAEGLKKFARSKKHPLKRVIIESDARIALEGSFNGGAGIILIAGTGSIAFGKDAKGNVHRVGGWGRILGDEGSGYFLGRLGLTAITRHMDGRGEITKLTAMAAKQFGLTDQTAIINAVYKENFDVASIAPLVISAAEKRDAVCRAIVENAVVELAWHVQVAAEKLSTASKKKVKEKIHVAFIGGLIANDTLVAKLLKQYLALHFPVIEIIPPMSSPAFGAVVMGRSQSSRS